MRQSHDTDESIPEETVHPKLRTRVRLHDSRFEIHSPIAVIVSCSRATLLAINGDATRLAGHRGKPALAIALEPQAPPGIRARRLHFRRKEVLAEKKVFRAITVEVVHHGGKRGRQLRLGG